MSEITIGLMNQIQAPEEGPFINDSFEYHLSDLRFEIVLLNSNNQFADGWDTVHKFRYLKTGGTYMYMVFI